MLLLTSVWRRRHTSADGIAPFVFAMCMIVSASNADAPRLKRHWKLTEDETVWTVRYTNCDYGYYVLLPHGMVGHGTHPPNPNHGIGVILRDVTSEHAFSANSERWLYIDASYHTADPPVEDSIKRLGEGERRVRLAALRAVESRSKMETGVDEATVAVRRGIGYTISLHTDAAHYNTDKMQYQRLIEGFRLSRLPLGQCTNG